MEGSLRCHVLGWHAAVAGHAAWLASGDLGVVVFGGVDLALAVDAISIAGGGFGGVQAGLAGDHVRDADERMRKGMQRTWMRFLPSGLVTSGCSLGVVKV
jgi:hypothetical protein